MNNQSHSPYSLFVHTDNLVHTKIANTSLVGVNLVPASQEFLYKAYLYQESLPPPHAGVWTWIAFTETPIGMKHPSLSL